MLSNLDHVIVVWKEWSWDANVIKELCWLDKDLWDAFGAGAGWFRVWAKAQGQFIQVNCVGKGIEGEDGRDVSHGKLHINGFWQSWCRSLKSTNSMSQIRIEFGGTVLLELEKGIGVRTNVRLAVWISYPDLNIPYSDAILTFDLSPLPNVRTALLSPPKKALLPSTNRKSSNLRWRLDSTILPSSNDIMYWVSTKQPSFGFSSDQGAWIDSIFVTGWVLVLTLKITEFSFLTLLVKVRSLSGKWHRFPPEFKVVFLALYLLLSSRSVSLTLLKTSLPVSTSGEHKDSC